MSDLSEKKCLPCEGGVDALSIEKTHEQLKKIKDWQLSDDNQWIKKSFEFKNFYRTMTFVNAVAWVANQENHHPDIELGYNYCNIRYQTHAVGGLSDNDFICASKIDDIISE